MATEAAPEAAAAAPAVEGSPPNGVATPPPVAAGGAPPAAGARPADGKAPEAAPPTLAKGAWDRTVKIERESRDRVKAAETRAKTAEDAAKARVTELEAKLAEAAPLLELLSKKDAKALLTHLGVSVVDIATMVAEEGKPPTIEELEERAATKALTKLQAEQKARDDAAAETKRKADEKAAADAQAEKNARFVGAVKKHFTSVEAELRAEGNAEKYKALHTVDELLPALGLDKGHDDIEWGSDEKGQPLTVRMNGGSSSTRAALTLVLQAAGRGEKVSVTDALAAVQSKAMAVLQKIAELPTFAGTNADKKTDKKTPGRAAQPTLTSRSTTAPVVAPIVATDDDGQLGASMSAVQKAIDRVPGLAQKLAPAVAVG